MRDYLSSTIIIIYEFISPAVTLDAAQPVDRNIDLYFSNSKHE